MSVDLGTLVVGLKLDDGGFGAGIKSAQQQYAQSAQSISTASTAMAAEAGAAWDRLAASSSQAVQNATARLEQAVAASRGVGQAAQDESNDVVRALQAEIAELQRAVEELKKHAKGHQESHEQIKESLEKLQEGLKGYAERVMELTGQQSAFTPVVNASTQALTGLATGSLGAAAGIGLIGAAMIAAAGTATVMAAEWQHSVSTLSTDMGTSVEEAGQLASAFQQLSTEIPKSAQELTEAFGSVAGRLELMRGEVLSAAEAEELMRTASEGAIAGHQSLSAATDALVKQLMASHSALTEQGHIMDTLYNTSRLTGVGYEMLAMIMGRLEARMGDSAPKIEGVGFALAVMTEAGISGQRAMMPVMSMLQQLANPSEKAKAALDELNVTLSHNKDGSLDLFQTMMDLRQGFSEITDAEEKHRIAQALVGEGAGYLESAMKLTAKQMEDAKKKVDEVGTAEEAAQKHSRDLTERMEELGNRSHITALEFGGPLVQALLNYGDESDALAKRTQNLHEIMGQFTVKGSDNIKAAQELAKEFVNLKMTHDQVEESLKLMHAEMEKTPGLSFASAAAMEEERLKAEALNKELRNRPTITDIRGGPDTTSTPAQREARRLAQEAERTMPAIDVSQKARFDTEYGDASKVAMDVTKAMAAGPNTWPKIREELIKASGDLTAQLNKEGVAAATEMGDRLGALINIPLSQAKEKLPEALALLKEMGDASYAQKEAYKDDKKQETEAEREAKREAAEAAREQKRLEAEAVREAQRAAAEQQKIATEWADATEDTTRKVVKAEEDADKKVLDAHDALVDAIGKAEDTLARKTEEDRNRETMDTQIEARRTQLEKEIEDLRDANQRKLDVLREGNIQQVEELKAGQQNAELEEKQGREKRDAGIREDRALRQSTLQSQRQRQDLATSHNERVQDIQRKGGTPEQVQASLQDENRSFAREQQRASLEQYRAQADAEQKKKDAKEDQERKDQDAKDDLKRKQDNATAEKALQTQLNEEVHRQERENHNTEHQKQLADAKALKDLKKALEEEFALDKKSIAQREEQEQIAAAQRKYAAAQVAAGVSVDKAIETAALEFEKLNRRFGEQKYGFEPLHGQSASDYLGESLGERATYTPPQLPTSAAETEALRGGKAGEREAGEEHYAMRDVVFNGPVFLQRASELGSLVGFWGASASQTGLQTGGVGIH